MACGRDFFCDLISTGCAGLFSASCFRACRRLCYCPLAVCMIISIHRDFMNSALIDHITYCAVDRFIANLCAGRFLIYCILFIPSMAQCRNCLCFLVAAVSTNSFFTSIACTGCINCYCPITVSVVFHRDRTDSGLINRVTYGTVNRHGAFLCAGCFPIYCIFFFPDMCFVLGITFILNCFVFRDFNRQSGNSSNTSRCQYNCQ